jgi:hypothetical protein
MELDPNEIIDGRDDASRGASQCQTRPWRFAVSDLVFCFRRPGRREAFVCVNAVASTPAADALPFSRFRSDRVTRPATSRLESESVRTCLKIPVSVLDLSPIREGGSAAESFKNTLDLARHVEAGGWVPGTSYLTRAALPMRARNGGFSAERLRAGGMQALIELGSCRAGRTKLSALRLRRHQESAVVG